MISHASTRRFWDSRATALGWRINAAAWLALMAPVVFFEASGFAIALYALRRAQSPLGSAWVALAVALALAAVACWWRARRGFYTTAEARVLLESHLRLDTCLTAATEGLVAWPAEPAQFAAVVRWRLGAPAGWVGTSVALLALAVFAPVPSDASTTHPSGPPPAILQTEAMLAALKEMKLSDPPAIEQLAERARELARRPADEQYSHSALEAADALRNQTAVAAAGLARGLDAAANALQAANKEPDMKGAAGRLAAALSGLRDGALPANKELLANLPNSLEGLKDLTAEQRAQLAEMLAKAAQGAQGVAGATGAGAKIAKGEGDGPGGGPGGGGDTAPLTFSKDPSDAGDGTVQGLAQGSLKRFALGDKLGTTSSSHDVDPAKAAGPTSAGAVATPAQGGEAVWVNRLTPTERAALKNFYK